METNSLYNTKYPENPLDWYTLTETSNSILNELIAYTGREEFLETEKEHPDQLKIEALEKLFEEVNEIIRNTENFKHAGKMQEIIDKYGPLLKKLNKANLQII